MDSATETASYTSWSSAAFTAPRARNRVGGISTYSDFFIGASTLPTARTGSGKSRSSAEDASDCIIYLEPEPLPLDGPSPTYGYVDNRPLDGVDPDGANAIYQAACASIGAGVGGLAGGPVGGFVGGVLGTGAAVTTGGVTIAVTLPGGIATGTGVGTVAGAGVLGGLGWHLCRDGGLLGPPLAPTLPKPRTVPGDRCRADPKPKPWDPLPLPTFAPTNPKGCVVVCGEDWIGEPEVFEHPEITEKTACDNKAEDIEKSGNYKPGDCKGYVRGAIN